jgi:hypothetical protein
MDREGLKLSYPSQPYRNSRPRERARRVTVSI